ncbi:uncharacterized protein LOC129289666 isoform X2 [Prosopis cineraria]|uniref:uncharacterized protein LOC129289666 isoform X2 n=1 Tax=Prosopis cineraria TaxID=364024 RepID=UPI0024108583|nr:uncharacterized protein LOC129289666 isoform X2 [Prosopis cineraria]
MDLEPPTLATDNPDLGTTSGSTSNNNSTLQTAVGSNSNDAFVPQVSPTPSLRGKSDLTWENFAFKKYTCLHCSLSFRRGRINRMKQHLVGVSGNIISCKKVPHDVRHRMVQSLKEVSLVNKRKLDDSDMSEEFIDNPEGEVITPNPEPSKQAKKDIASMPHVADLATKASKITVFVYNHMAFLSWLRRRDGWIETMHPGVTRCC